MRARLQDDDHLHAVTVRFAEDADVLDLPGSVERPDVLFDDDSEYGWPTLVRIWARTRSLANGFAGRRIAHRSTE